jgi:basic membrane protein A
MLCRAFEALQAEYGFNLRIVELGAQGMDRPRAIEGLHDVASQMEWDFIVTSAGVMADVFQYIAPQYPNQRFLVFDARYDFEEHPAPNVYSANFKQNESAFLAGVLAMSMSESGRIGFVGGVATPVINDFLVGYIEGALYVNENAEVLIAFTEDWFDTSKAKELGLTLINHGADVIFPAAGPASDGVMQAGAEMDTFLIGVDNDRYFYYAASPDIQRLILSSALKKVDVAATRAAYMWLDDTLVFGAHEVLGINEGGVGLADNANFQSLVPENVRSIIAEAEARVLRGEYTVLSAFGLTTAQIDEIRASVTP